MIGVMYLRNLILLITPLEVAPQIVLLVRTHGLKKFLKRPLNEWPKKLSFSLEKESV